MATPERAIPHQRTAEDQWKHLFSYHAFAPVLDRAEGIYLYDTDGNRYIDASGGPIAMNIAHGDRRVIEAITRQAEKYAYCHPALSNQPRAEVCARIANLAPGNLNTSYLCSGGSEAVETAIKIARQYHVARGNEQKHFVIGICAGRGSMDARPALPREKTGWACGLSAISWAVNYGATFPSLPLLFHCPRSS